jgi:hypothetical protein
MTLTVQGVGILEFWPLRDSALNQPQSLQLIPLPDRRDRTTYRAIR